MVSGGFSVRLIRGGLFCIKCIVIIIIIIVIIIIMVTDGQAWEVVIFFCKKQ